MYYSTSVPNFDLTELSEDCIRIRGNRYKFTQHHCHHDLRKYTLKIYLVYDLIINKYVIVLICTNSYSICNV